ncbi:hypothetical protein CH378_20120 [Leptospira kmetyi]|uniref:DUF1564 family protein n=1 Tax=Leptospira kmetyi TaxID=408139 RepID=A0ABX4N508_9LEPT|nr:hypothetical protein CH378_20120 [Leptospira kmetyi]
MRSSYSSRPLSETLLILHLISPSDSNRFSNHTQMRIGVCEIGHRVRIFFKKKPFSKRLFSGPGSASYRVTRPFFEFC